jgi:hypothetical protein
LYAVKSYVTNQFSAGVNSMFVKQETEEDRYTAYMMAQLIQDADPVVQAAKTAKKAFDVAASFIPVVNVAVDIAEGHFGLAVLDAGLDLFGGQIINGIGRAAGKVAEELYEGSLKITAKFAKQTAEGDYRVAKEYERLRFESDAATSVYKQAVKEEEEGYITLYRGERPNASRVMKSYAAREGGYAYSQDLIKKGNMTDLMIAHAKDSRDPASPFISLTSDPRVAEYFAGEGGTIFTLRISNNRATFNIYNNFMIKGGIPESEYLVPNYIRLSEIVGTKTLP